MRRISLTLLLVAVACSDAPEDQQAEGGTRASTRKGDPAPAVAAPTGSKVFQRDAESIANDLKRLEAQGRPADADALARFEKEVRLRLQHIDLTLKALGVSIQAESRQIVQQAYALLRARQSDVIKRIDSLFRETSEVRDALEAHRKGQGELPPGFTADELQDRLKDLEKQMAKLREEESEVIGQLDEKVKLLEGDAIPEQGTTVLTQERAVFEALRERAEKLLQKS